MKGPGIPLILTYPPGSIIPHSLSAFKIRFLLVLLNTYQSRLLICFLFALISNFCHIYDKSFLFVWFWYCYKLFRNPLCWLLSFSVFCFYTFSECLILTCIQHYKWLSLWFYSFQCFHYISGKYFPANPVLSFQFHSNSQNSFHALHTCVSVFFENIRFAHYFALCH